MRLRPPSWSPERRRHSPRAVPAAGLAVPVALPARAPARERNGPADRSGPAANPGAGDRGDRGDRNPREPGAGPERGNRDAAGPERGGRGPAGERGGRAGARDHGSVRGAVGRLDTRQRTEFRSSITRLGVSPLRDVAFGLTVGTAIPRSVSLHRLPPAIIELVPQYEGYNFILVRDDIVIIDPDTYEIVDVIPA
ncbi:DUF1236 domain-containing protein [Methylobacterium oryzae]|uniref:DUF1236 domain-containing protein n=1 Tax=Methylobacterium oryzae TaxID=334852 RepID=UPI002F355BA2